LFAERTDTRGTHRDRPLCVPKGVFPHWQRKRRGQASHDRPPQYGHLLPHCANSLQVEKGKIVVATDVNEVQLGHLATTIWAPYKDRLQVAYTLSNAKTQLTSGVLKQIAKLDVRSLEQWKAVFAAVVQQYKSIDVVFNVAGYLKPGPLISQVPRDSMETELTPPRNNPRPKQRQTSTWTSTSRASCTARRSRHSTWSPRETRGTLSSWARWRLSARSLAMGCTVHPSMQHA